MNDTIGVNFLWWSGSLLLALIELVVVTVGVFVLSVLVILRIRQQPTYRETMAFPHRFEAIPLVRHLSVHIGLKRIARSQDDYCVLFLNFILGEIERLRKDGLYVLYMGAQPNFVIYRADHVAKILSNSTNLSKGHVYNLLVPWLGRGLLTSSGQKWKTRRRLLTPAFHFRILEKFAPIMNREAKVFVERLAHKDPNEDIVPYISAVTLAIACEAIMGVNLGCQTVGTGRRYLESIGALEELFFERVQSPLNWVDWIYNMTKAGRANRKYLSELHAFTLQVIRERKQELQANPEELERIAGAEENLFKSKKLFLDILLIEHLKHGTLTERDIREEVDTFMFEGHDTTSMGITWAVYLVGLYPDVQKRLHSEIDAVMGADGCLEEVTVEHIKQCRYLDMVLKESQRIYPSVPMIARRVTEPLTILDKPVPIGSELNINLIGLHRDPSVFPRPEVFDPDRFSAENTRDRNQFAFVPFSAGPRNCIGQRFAFIEEKIILVWLLRRFWLRSLDPRDTIKMAAEMVLRPRVPIRIEFTPRLG